MEKKPESNMFDALFGAILGEVDETKQYYTEDMFKKDSGGFILALLLHKGLVTEEEVREFKEEWMDSMNKLLIADMKNLRKNKGEKEDE
jgi:hypothetical protein